MNEYLPLASLLRLLATLALVLAPHAARLPLWESGLLGTLMLWRGVAGFRRWRMPPTLVKAALTLAAFAAVYGSYGRVSGQHAGVALLAVMLCLKLTELNTRRDVMVAVFICYFMLLTHFLFSQELWTLLYLLGSAVAITAVLVDVNHAGSALPLRLTLRLGGGLVAQSLPLMLLMFVLFPRVPGPLWGLPADAGASARPGLSDQMSPGDISKLVESDELAFRVRFDGPRPAAQELYWRGPVFGQFDGRSWTAGFRNPRQQAALPEVETEARTLAYEVMLEPTRMPWLFALDLPDAAALPPRSWLGADYQLLAEKPVNERLLYRAASHPEYRFQPQLPDALRAATTRLPRNYNPRTLALAQQWRTETPDGAALVQRALQLFREKAFYYTLEPPLLGRDSIDDFLFDTQRGFCEHYASSFTVLMRAAGIPARVVTGYQGGEAAAYGDYFVVRQSDAHAWSEVWLTGRGWVRVDPTAAVAPERIERGIQSALGDGSDLPAALRDRLAWNRLRFMLESRWDWANAQWYRWVLGYGDEMQHDFLSRLGLIDWSRMILALTFSISALAAVMGLVLLRRSQPPPVRDGALRLWRQGQRRLKRLGLEQGPGEGPRDFAHRVAAARPQLQSQMDAALDAYLRLRYGSESDPALERQLAAAVKRLKVEGS